MISVYGSSGFIGSRFCNLYFDSVIKIPRDQRAPESKNVLYLISTTDNYSVFSDPTIDVKTNLLVLTETLEKAKDNVEVFNFVSSWFVYGDTSLPAKESAYCSPKGFYSITKYCAEQLVESYCKTHKIPYRIIRLCNVYGNGDLGVSKKKNALQYLIERLKNNDPIQLYNGGDFIRDYMHVDDISRAINLILESAPTNSTINVGCGKPVQFKSIIDLAVKFLDSKSEITDMEPPEFHKLVQVKNMYLDTEKLESLGFIPKITIEEGIRELCQA